MISVNKVVPCAGIIVFDGDRTILVSTDSGNHSFPKGKRHKPESDLETAWREFNEETGLTKEHVKLVSNEPVDEMSGKGNPSVRYFVGHLIKNPGPFKFDPSELESVSWHRVDAALAIEKFKTARKEILKMAYEKYKSVMERASGDIDVIKKNLNIFYHNKNSTDKPYVTINSFNNEELMYFELLVAIYQNFNGTILGIVEIDSDNSSLVIRF